MKIGIQGGKGSFNEQALTFHAPKLGLNQYEVSYLHTSEAVMRALVEGSIDYGQLALFNSSSGLVEESLSVIGRYPFEVSAHYQLPIQHALLGGKFATLATIDTIITHPQILPQCKNALASRFSRIRTESGSGETVDQAKVAELIAAGELPQNVATIGSEKLAQVFGLQVLATELHDDPKNETTFLLLKKFG